MVEPIIPDINSLLSVLQFKNQMQQQQLQQKSLLNLLEEQQVEKEARNSMNQFMQTGDRSVLQPHMASIATNPSYMQAVTNRLASDLAQDVASGKITLAEAQAQGAPYGVSKDQFNVMPNYSDVEYQEKANNYFTKLDYDLRRTNPNISDYDVKRGIYETATYENPYFLNTPKGRELTTQVMQIPDNVMNELNTILSSNDSYITKSNKSSQLVNKYAYQPYGQLLNTMVSDGLTNTRYDIQYETENLKEQMRREKDLLDATQKANKTITDTWDDERKTYIGNITGVAKNQGLNLNEQALTWMTARVADGQPIPVGGIAMSDVSNLNTVATITGVDFNKIIGIVNQDPTGMGATQAKTYNTLEDLKKDMESYLAPKEQSIGMVNAKDQAEVKTALDKLNVLDNMQANISQDNTLGEYLYNREVPASRLQALPIYGTGSTEIPASGNPLDDLLDEDMGNIPTGVAPEVPREVVPEVPVVESQAAPQVIKPVAGAKADMPPSPVATDVLPKEPIMRKGESTIKESGLESEVKDYLKGMRWKERNPDNKFDKTLYEKRFSSDEIKSLLNQLNVLSINDIKPFVKDGALDSNDLKTLLEMAKKKVKLNIEEFNP